MTASGYPRIVKLWKRGEPLTDARTIYEGKHSDVGAQGSCSTIRRDYRAGAARRQFLCRRVSFHRTDGTIRQLPLPLAPI